MPNYEWKSVRTNEQKLAKTLNELQEKTEWEIFNIFSHSDQTQYRLYTTTTLVIVLRKPLPDPPPQKATVASIGDFCRNITECCDNMTSEDIRRGLIAAGIITEDGELAEKYQEDEDEENA